MRPLMVRTEKGSGPLFWSRLPVSGWVGGGGSRLLGLEAELDGGLVGGLAEAGQEIANLLLAGVEDLAGWRVVDGIGHPPTELLELHAELLDEGLGGDLRWAIHGRFLEVGWEGANGPPGPLAIHRLRYALPEDLPRPRFRESARLTSAGPTDRGLWSSDSRVANLMGRRFVPAR